MNTPRSEIEAVLSRRTPGRFVFAPNLWQWFAHQQNHDRLPEEIRHCRSQLDLLRYLGADIFSRNVYCNQSEYWFGGICEEYFEGFDVKISIDNAGINTITVKEYISDSGILQEKLSYVFNESTVVQQEFLIKDYLAQWRLLEKFAASRRWKFNMDKYNEISQRVGEDGIVILGDFFSPLKMLHIAMGPINTVYFLAEYPSEAKVIMDLHEKAQLEVIEQASAAGVKVIMSMDNLDTMFHPPDYVENYSASFYEKASALCHENGAKFFIHACGHQKDNLRLISSYNVDGLEGVAFPPLGDIELEEAFNLTGDDFIITGGISAIETRDLKSREEVFTYVRDLFARLKPFKNRFIFSSSCNTAINAEWETIKHFRDAWREYSEM